jgi:hypothetical protein
MKLILISLKKKYNRDLYINNFMDRTIFIIALIIVLVLFYVNKMYETYVSGSYDITPSITVDMDWKGATLSKYPYYTNNLVNPPANILNKIQQLQKYQPKEDGPTDTTYVTTGMSMQQNLDNPNSREGFETLEGFSMMNPYVSQ